MLASASRLFLPVLSLILLPILSARPEDQCLGSDLGCSPAELLSALDVQARLADPSWRILDARRTADYRTAHIPGAVSVDTAQWVRHTQEPAGLKDREYWSRAVASLGIERTTAVLVYGDNVATAAQIWWLLAYLGVSRVAILDGGWQAWEIAGLPQVTEVPDVVVDREFRANFVPGWLAERDQSLWMRESGEVQIIDVRSQAEFSGQRALGGRAGRIPHAIHLDWLDVLDAQSYFKEAGELKELLKAKGISTAKRQVVYCYSGARSSVVVFALRRIGYCKASNYYGGWQQWSASDESPVDAGPGL